MSKRGPKFQLTAQQKARRAKEYRQNAASKRRWRSRRDSMNMDWVNNHKALHGCCRCGEKDPVVLDLHHIPGTIKKAAISTMIRSTPLLSIIAEAAKCMVICANCHRREHHRQRLAGPPHVQMSLSSGDDR